MRTFWRQLAINFIPDCLYHMKACRFTAKKRTLKDSPYCMIVLHVLQ